jgi:hypothetical protein
MPNLAVRPRELVDHSFSRLRRAKCPSCNRSISCAEDDCRFDDHGFESYQIDCGYCRAELIGIVDPADDALLLSIKSAE